MGTFTFFGQKRTWHIFGKKYILFKTTLEISPLCNIFIFFYPMHISNNLFFIILNVCEIRAWFLNCHSVIVVKCGMWKVSDGLSSWRMTKPSLYYLITTDAGQRPCGNINTLIQYILQFCQLLSTDNNVNQNNINFSYVMIRNGISWMRNRCTLTLQVLCSGHERYSPIPQITQSSII